jgi:carboxylate-amine ligase
VSISYHHTFTLGIEEEYMVMDSMTGELKSHEQKIVQEGQKIFGEKVKAEMHQAVVEVGTDVCKHAEEVHRDICRLRKTVYELAGTFDLSVGASGTHPYSLWEKQLITDQDRYNQIVWEMQDAARSNLIFGLHVHVGMESREMAIHIANSVRYFLPHVFCLSTNSPFWEGRDTGYKSYRTKVFEKFPRTGIPDHFDSIEDYDRYVHLLIKTNCIDSPRKIWWDLRVHPVFNTVEFRICDVPLTAMESACLASLFQCICAKIYKLRMRNMNFITYSRALINENKFRASRYGIEGKLIDFGIETEKNVPVLIHELLDFVDDVVDDLGCRDYIHQVTRILEEGTGAEKQLRKYKETGELRDVTHLIQDSFLSGI